MKRIALFLRQFASRRQRSSVSRGCSAGGRLSAASARWAAATAAVEAATTAAATATATATAAATTTSTATALWVEGRREGVETGKLCEWRGETELRGWHLPMRVESDRVTTTRFFPLTATARGGVVRAGRTFDRYFAD